MVRTSPVPSLVRVAEEAVRRERHAVAQPAAEDVADRHAPRLAEDVEAGELQRRQDLRAVVVERRGRIGDHEPHLLEARRIMADEIAASCARNDGLGRFAAAAHLAEPDQPVVGFDFDDGADEAPPVAAVGMPQRRFERDGDGRGPNVGDLHTSMSQQYHRAGKRLVVQEKQRTMSSAPLKISPPAAVQPGIRGLRWYICALLFFATTLTTSTGRYSAFWTPTSSGQSAGARWKTGYIVTSFQAAYAIGYFFVGRMMDSISTRKGFAIILGIWSLAAMAHAAARSAIGFAIARAALGLGEAGNFPASIKTVAEWFPKQERALATGIFNAGSNVGAIAAPIRAGGLH